MKDDESVPKMFHRLNMIVNELRALGHKVYDEDFSHKFLRCLPSRFDTLVTIIVRGGFDNLTPTQVLLEVVTQDTFDQEKVENEKEEQRRKMSQVMMIAQAQALMMPQCLCL
jgi:hypothetical protein